MSEFLPPIPAAVDRGPAMYFHGRTSIRRNFDELLERSLNSNTGTTFLVQGASGVGKSALLYECRKQAEEKEWNVAKIGLDCFWDPLKLRSSLGHGRTYEVTERSTQFGVKNVVERGYRSVRYDPTVEDILKDGRQPLLLILDEAHALADENFPPSQYLVTTVQTLELIHNDELGTPVILLAAGLEGARKGFSKLKISRFGEDCLVDLGALSKESERAVIRDWLTKGGSDKEDPTPWMDAIALETHGWPLHIQSYARHAANYLKANDGVMTSVGLEAVLNIAQEKRKVYYKQRVGDFRVDQIRCLARSISDIPPGEPAEFKEIMTSLTGSMVNVRRSICFRN